MKKSAKSHSSKNPQNKAGSLQVNRALGIPNSACIGTMNYHSLSNSSRSGLTNSDFWRSSSRVQSELKIWVFPLYALPFFPPSTTVNKAKHETMVPLVTTGTKSRRNTTKSFSSPVSRSSSPFRWVQTAESRDAASYRVWSAIGRPPYFATNKKSRRRHRYYLVWHC